MFKKVLLDLIKKIARFYSSLQCMLIRFISLYDKGMVLCVCFRQSVE